MEFFHSHCLPGTDQYIVSGGLHRARKKLVSHQLLVEDNKWDKQLTGLLCLSRIGVNIVFGGDCKHLVKARVWG